MRTVSKKIALIAFGLILLFTPISAQQKPSRENKTGLRDYLSTLAEQSTLVTECEQNRAKSTDRQMIIAGRCEYGGGGCPVRLVKPRYPSNARELKLHSVVEVDVIADESGRIIYSKMIQGSKFFKRTAERAARRSQFRPVIHCGKAVKQRFTIAYNFSI